MRSMKKDVAVKEQDRDKKHDFVRMTASTDGLKFTGIARSVICFENQGNRNFKILSLYIKDGVVTDIEQSDPYANFELIAKLEIQNHVSVLNLNDRWEDGKALLK